jgi:hypothetical protein
MIAGPLLQNATHVGNIIVSLVTVLTWVWLIRYRRHKTHEEPERP